ncbi:MAG: hypothetical protein JJE08_06705 [Proteiniphilum sp.]|nr:hypothetical protein [Proteiniphilum sp.]
MDFVDILLNRFDGESELKKPTNALVCFTQPETGKRLSRLAFQIAMSRPDKSAITLLHFIDKKEEMQPTEETNGSQGMILADFMPKGEKSKITMRSFVRESDDHLADIMKMTEEQQCNLVLIGISYDELDLKVVERYSRLRSDPANPAAAILEQFTESEVKRLQEISSLVSRNSVPTGIFIDNGLTEGNNIFVPILSKADVHIFTFVHHTAQKENVKIMIWDAIGIIASEPKMQKLYQFIVKKTDGRVQLWNDDRKIEEEFIRKQDLVIIGVEGWVKLINAPLQWKESLPSTLIIKDITT